MSSHIFIDMKNLARISTLLLVLGVARLAGQTQINFSSSAFEVGHTSTGAPLTSQFIFALGSFGSFVPTGSNISLWAANFTPVPTNGTVAWDAEGFTQFTQTATLPSNSAGFATTNHAYIWGYNNQAITTGTEWILFANTNWLFPSASATDPTSWDINDAGTTAVVGILNALGSTPYIQTVAVSAVPEPSTYAALFGLAAIGIVAYRRRQQAA